MEPTPINSDASLHKAPSDAYTRYETEIDVDSDSVHAKVVRLVGVGKRVLELGCSTGYMSRVLRDRGCQVVAVEIDGKAAERALAFCERVIMGDIEKIDLSQELGQDRFDVVVAADFLEHLKDPLSVLLAVKKHLRPEGYIVASLPNVAHGSVRLALLSGNFQYKQVGLLDETHLHFYTRESFQKLLEDAGFAVGRLDRHELVIDASEVRYDRSMIPEGLLYTLSADPDALTYQFIAVAYPMPRAELRLIQQRMGQLVGERESLLREVARLQQALHEKIGHQERVEELLEEREAIGQEVARLRLVVQGNQPLQEEHQSLQQEHQSLQEKHRCLQCERDQLVQLIATRDREQRSLQRQLKKSSEELQAIRGELLTALSGNTHLLADRARLLEEVAARDRIIEGVYAGRIWRLATPIFALHHLSKKALSSTSRLGKRVLSIGAPEDQANSGALDTHVSEQSLPVPEDTGTFVDSIPHWPQRQDIICFTILEWDFGFQRPHQVVSQFADRGHRVFYASLAKVCPANAASKFVAHQLRERIYEVHLAEHCGANVYGQVLADHRVNPLLESIESLCAAHNVVNPVMLVQLPFWTPLALELRKRHGWKMVYDCMDEWNGFPGWDEETAENDKWLVDECDLLLVSSQRLFEKWGDKRNDRCLLVRNAANFEHFRRARPNDLLDGIGHPIVGYFGAIAGWFDIELVQFLARSRPDYHFVLLGWTSGIDISQLEAFPNVHYLGKKAYGVLPDYLYHFDVCIIPFLVNHVTEAVDPVKFYEYVSLGKPVVAPRMPELYQYRGLLYIADDHEDFLNKLDTALAESDPELVGRRIELAQQNTWQHRMEVIEAGVKRIHGRASIVTVTYNNVGYTRQCIDSVLRNSLWPDIEIIIVDNASTDGTRTYLRHLEHTVDCVKIILNSENLGFGKANNQGLAVATGEYVVLLNNDTVVPNGWLPRLLRHLERDPRIGLVGPVTNFSGNETKIDVTYDGMEGIDAFAEQYVTPHEGEVFDIAMLPMHCVAFRRSVFEQVGYIDERFEVGMFEDDDYSRRVRLAGYRVVCAEDAFVHHFGKATFKTLSSTEYQQIFDRNRQRFEQKWGGEWLPHRHRATI
ncbi:MAG: glycosyltransferase [Chloroflexi bacterium]|nr:glycosyltransferase [Chloroflexota bacterium]